MPKILEAKLKIESWDEQPYQELAEGSKLTRADVALSGPADGLASGTFEALMFYRADGTSSYVSLMYLTGTVDGQAGSFVLQGTGTFDGTAARGESHVLAGSGTGELTGLTGTAQSVSTHADYPLMPLTLRYDLG
jgi:Protein of unknown function (DUF3224)